MVTIRVPRPAFVLGDRSEPPQPSVTMRPIYGHEDEDGKRQIVGYIDQYAPEFEEIWQPLVRKRGGRRRVP